MIDASPLVVFGGGGLGSAVARLAAVRGSPVTVASRHAAEHVGWWRHAVVGGDAPLGWLPARAQVVVAIGPGPREREAETWSPAVVRWLERLRALRPASIVLVVPEGVGRGPAFSACVREVLGGGGTVVRVPALLASTQGWAGSIAAELRGGGSPRVSTAIPDARALAVEDAARVVLAELGEAGEVTVTGPERLSAAAVVAALEARYATMARRRLFGTGVSREALARLHREANLPDAWDEARYGPRLSLSAWVDRLPGPRRRRVEN